MTATPPVSEGEAARLSRFDELCRQADPGDWTALPVSAHAHLLLLDLRAAFGGGAWLSVVVLA